MNKLLIIVLTFSFIFSNDQIDIEINKIVQGNYNREISNNVSYDEKDEEQLFLLGLIEIDGEKSKNYMEEYFETSNTKYKDQSIIKIAEYYYAKGLYVQSSQWYKKIPLDYPDSKHRDVAINYYLNSLMISGENDTAKFYSKKFQKQYKNLNFNKEYVEPISRNFTNSIPKKNNKTIYSVQIGSYRNYQSAVKKKKILSSEGFLCRIDEVRKGPDIFYSVRVGNFNNKSIATKEQKRLKSRVGIYDTIIVRIN